MDYWRWLLDLCKWVIAVCLSCHLSVQGLNLWQGEQHGPRPILLTLICARADSTEPAGYALWGSIASVSKDVSYWLDRTLSLMLPRKECNQSEKKSIHLITKPRLQPNTQWFIHHCIIQVTTFLSSLKYISNVASSHGKIMRNTFVKMQNWLAKKIKNKKILKEIIVIRGLKKNAYNIPCYHLGDNDWEPHQFCHIHISPARLQDNYISQRIPHALNFTLNPPLRFSFFSLLWPNWILTLGIWPGWL